MRQIVDKPSPITGGSLELYTEQATVNYRGETVSFEKSFYRCVDSGMEFTDEELDNANLKLMYDTYRRLHGIPTAEELKTMRERYGIPSGAMSIILGLGENQFGLYEDGVVPTASVGKLLAMAADLSVMKGLLQSARAAFSEKQYRKYFSSIISSMPPARYEVRDMGLLDYESFSSFPASHLMINKPKTSSNAKMSYNDFCYAGVCG